MTIGKRDALLASNNARWLLLERDETVRLLALESYLRRARSGDVTDGGGRSVEESAVRAWVKDNVDLGRGSLARAMGAPAPRELPPPLSVRAPRADDTSRARTDGSQREREARRTEATLDAILGRLRVASVDRLARELARVDAAITPTATREALSSLVQRGQAKLIGRSVAYAARDPREGT